MPRTTRQVCEGDEKDEAVKGWAMARGFVGCAGGWVVERAGGEVVNWEMRDGL